LRCVFGVTTVPATLVDARALRCDAPARGGVGAVPLSVSLNAEVSSRSLQHGNVSFTYYDLNAVIISALSPAQGPIVGGTPVTVRGQGLAAYGTVLCRFGNHSAVNASYAAVGTLSESDFVAPLSHLVCYTPPHTLRPDMGPEDGESVPVQLSLTGDAEEFTADHASFLYHHPCRGRHSMVAYPEGEARTAVTRYLTLNRPNLTAFDVNANGHLEVEELREALRNETAATPSAQALSDYASSTCFLEHEAGGRQLSRHDDHRTSDGLEIGPPTAPAVAPAAVRRTGGG